MRDVLRSRLPQCDRAANRERSEDVAFGVIFEVSARSRAHLSDEASSLLLFVDMIPAACAAEFERRIPGQLRNINGKQPLDGRLWGDVAEDDIWSARSRSMLSPGRSCGAGHKA